MAVEEMQKSKTEKFPTHSHNGILLPILEMSYPYYPHSYLASSPFVGFYVLFFMYCSHFIVIYPALNLLQGKEIVDMRVIKLVQTNILWDFISAALFIFLSLVMIQISTLRIVKGLSLLIVLAVGLFTGSGVFIVRAYDLYYTDRIFIIVLNWALAVKTISYLIDQHQQHPQWKQQEQRKRMNRFSHKIRFLISPVICYHRYVLTFDENLKIHPRYIIIKLIVSFLCLMINNIVVFQLIEPAYNSDLSIITMIFKLFPLTVYINLCLYCMVMDNVLAALAELTQQKNRVYYLDWWNSETIYEFLDKWCLLVTQFTDSYLAHLVKGRVRQCLHAGIMLTIMITIFGKSINVKSLLLMMVLETTLFLFGGMRLLQNNYIVHILTLGFTPMMIALQVKYQIFD